MYNRRPTFVDSSELLVANKVLTLAYLLGAAHYDVRKLRAATWNDDAPNLTFLLYFPTLIHLYINSEQKPDPAS
jgi:hypothetical protein